MSCFYIICGEAQVRQNPESLALIEKLEELLGGNFEYERAIEGGLLTFSVHNGDSCSYTTVSNIEDTLKELGQHALEPALFSTECDGEEEGLWIGPEPAVTEAIRQSAIQEARSQLLALSRKDAESLLQETLNSQFWSES